MPTKTDCHAAPRLDGVPSSSTPPPGSREQQEISQPAPQRAPTNATASNDIAMHDASYGAAVASKSQDTGKQINGNSDNNQTKRNNKNNNNKNCKNKPDVTEGNREADKKKITKNVVEELKLFQNSNLLNQQDPLEQLHRQLNQLILADVDAIGRFSSNIQQNNIVTNKPSEHLDQSANQISLSLQSTQSYPHETQAAGYNMSSNMFTVKKGVLWQQQNYDKFHQRLFSRWKKRFFILTTDYLVCFKRSTSKVGRSEMGKFLYKENLDEWMMLIDSMRIKRKLRGGPAEGINQVAMSSNQNGIYENAMLPSVGDGLLSNQVKHGSSDFPLKEEKSTQLMMGSTLSEQTASAIASSSVASSSEHFNHSLIERGNQNGNQLQMDKMGGNNVANYDVSEMPQGIKIGSPPPSRRLASMINDVGAPAEDESPRRMTQNLLSDDLMTSEKVQVGKKPQDESGSNAVSSSSSSTSHSSSVVLKRSGEDEPEICDSENSTNRTVLRDSNDNLVFVNDKAKPDTRMIGERISIKRQESKEKRHLESELKERIQDKQSAKQQILDTDDGERGRLQFVEQASSQRVEGRRSSKQERPVTNLIRRDDSWHSSLSLNKVANNHMQAAKRSLYAHHFMPSENGDQPFDNIGTENLQQHSNINSIDSTATPLRGRPPTHQQSMQFHINRRLPPIRHQQQANSCDTGQTTSSSSQQYNNEQQLPSTSYHQKLLQLQLLHNSNNIDYVRNNIGLNNGDRANNDYQIYGPGSIATTNHYGYYSMRSNLKSAASEFSFIRPSSSDFHHPAPAPALPPQQTHLSDRNGDVIQAQQHNNRPSLAVTNKHLLDYDNDCNNSPSSRCQYLMQNAPKDHAAKHINGHQNLNGLVDSEAPNRDLPLKPNKKRIQPPGSRVQSQKNSSTTLGSSIVHFFRRAFSKRSKRRPKHAESCSSSLGGGGAFDDKFESIQRARSAFSTTEGTRIDRSEITDQQQSAIKQRHRMIDLIEAFANKTATEQETYNKLSQQNHSGSSQYMSTMQRASIQNDIIMPAKLAQYRPQQLVGSPLHKSNSISTSTGLSGLNEMMRMNERQMMLNSQNSPASGPRSGPMSSPMVNRSTKVMSAHLTPSFNRKGVQDINGGYFASPRRSINLEHLPRPSSIYGQPSMISSPVSSNVRDNRGNEFGSHRSSIHSYHQRSDRGSLNSNIDLRRQTIKAPFLDTTREVAEEVSSPTTESKTFIDQEALINRQQTTDDCPSSNVINETTLKNYPIRQQQQRRAIVNPILQSPTMSLIYDNHPMPMVRNGVYSHYDNHRPIEYQQSMSSMDLSVHSYPQTVNPMVDAEDRNQRMTNRNSNAIIPPLVASRNSEMHQSYNVTHYTSGLVTPSHRNMRLSQQQTGPDGSYLLDFDRNLQDSAKPAAMVAPSTPTGQRGQESNYAMRAVIDSPSMGQLNPYSRSGARPNSIMKPSPVKIPQQPHSHYQQSPLVNRQTRIVKRGDGVQTTIIDPELPAPNSRQEAVVNIVGAPGVNLEPSLAHSILRGTNINAFESSTAGLHSNSNRCSTNTKTFLVASRLSKTIRESPTDAKSYIDEDRMLSESSGRKVEREQSRDDESSSRRSSGTNATSTSSSARSDLSARRKGSNETSAKSFQVDNGNRDSGMKAGRKEPSQSSDDSRHRGSSTEHSDELSSQAESFDDSSSEGRKWVTSKLMQ